MRVRAARFVFLAAFVAVFPAFSADPVAADGPVVQWFKRGHMIGGIEFSPDGREVLLDLRPYSRTAGSLPREVDRKKREARLYDPLIGVVTVADLRFTEIAHGRDGHFSPDGRAVAFIAQANPAPWEQFETGDDLGGNYAAVHDRASGKTVAMARPKWDVHSAPAFTPDGKLVTYLNLVAIDGVQHTRLTEFDLASRETRVLYDPPLVGKTPMLIWQYGHVGDRLLATLLVPQSATTLANARVTWVEQLVEIRDGKAIELFNWGPNDPQIQTIERLRILRDGAMTFEGRWRRISRDGGPGEPVGKSYGEDDAPGMPSPDGRLLARALTAKGESEYRYYTTLVVEKLDSGKILAQFHLDKARGQRPELIAWSTDSRRLAWCDFAATNWVDDHDTLFVAKLP